MKSSWGILLLMIGIFFSARGVFGGFDWQLRRAIHPGTDGRIGGEHSEIFSVGYPF